MALVHTHAPPQLQSARALSLRRPMRFLALGSRIPAGTEIHRCRRTLPQRTLASAVQQSRPAPSTQLVRIAPPRQDTFVLPRSQLANKQIITRTNGLILGVVEHLIADPQTFKVVALSCKGSKDLLPGDQPKQIGLLSLKQISDVLLVHNERALLQEPLEANFGYNKVVGLAVKTSDGRICGKVRDFEFSPDDGRITQLIIDALGIPSIPEKLLACASIRTQQVSAMTWNCITLRPGEEKYIQKMSGGLFDGAVNLLKSGLPFKPWEQKQQDKTVVRDDPDYVAWFAQYGERWEAQNQQKLAARPSDTALQQFRESQRFQQPQALPPGQQPQFAQQLQPQYQSQLQYDTSRVLEPAAYAPQQQAPMQNQYLPPQQQQQQQQPPSNWSQPGSQLPTSPMQQQQSPSSGPSQQGMPSQLQFQQQQSPEQLPGQLQQLPGQVPQPREDWYASQAHRSNPPPGASNKLEQQRRQANRAQAGDNEPRWDPRRRNAPASALGQRPPAAPQGAGNGLSLSQRPDEAFGRPAFAGQPGSSGGQYQGTGQQPARYGSQDPGANPVQGMANLPAQAQSLGTDAQWQYLPTQGQGQARPQQQGGAQQSFAGSSAQQQNGRGNGSNNASQGRPQQSSQSSGSDWSQRPFDTWAQVSQQPSAKPSAVTADKI